MVDGYQECLHCQYTHRSFSVKYPPTFYEVHNHETYSRHIADPAKPDDGLFLYFFPVCTLNLYGGGMSSFRVCPGEKVGETRMEFDYYFDDGKGGIEGFEDYFKFVRKVALEDFELCEVAQENLERGVYSQGVLNQVKESGVLRMLNPFHFSSFISFSIQQSYTLSGKTCCIGSTDQARPSYFPFLLSGNSLTAKFRSLDYQQLTRKMVVEKFKQEEAEKHALSPVSSRHSASGGVGYSLAIAPEDVAISA